MIEKTIHFRNMKIEQLEKQKTERSSTMDYLNKDPILTLNANRLKKS